MSMIQYSVLIVASTLTLFAISALAKSNNQSKIRTPKHCVKIRHQNTVYGNQGLCAHTFMLFDCGLNEINKLKFKIKAVSDNNTTYTSRSYFVGEGSSKRTIGGGYVTKSNAFRINVPPCGVKKFIVYKATGHINGKKVNLLKHDMVKIAKPFKPEPIELAK